MTRTHWKFLRASHGWTELIIFLVEFTLSVGITIIPTDNVVLVKLRIRPTPEFPICINASVLLYKCQCVVVV